ncbi:hypothetical protein AU476_09005 [Cupriavidus sp. UYMSc13B]|nr:hypothetical protein AU476_09005 [Cupriavidus sp. UYMSc13B]
MQRDREIAEEVDRAFAGREPVEHPVDKAAGGAGIGAMPVGGIVPVHAAQGRLVATVDAAAVAIQAFADGFAVEQFAEGGGGMWGHDGQD